MQADHRPGGGVDPGFEQGLYFLDGKGIGVLGAGLDLGQPGGRVVQAKALVLQPGEEDVQRAAVVHTGGGGPVFASQPMDELCPGDGGEVAELAGEAVEEDHAFSDAAIGEVFGLHTGRPVRECLFSVHAIPRWFG